MGEYNTCRICNRPKVEHDATMRHAFVGPDDPGGLRAAQRPSHDDESADPEPQGPIRTQLQGDPVLRIALIRKGLLTPEDLDEVERELKGAGFAVAQTLGQS